MTQGATRRPDAVLSESVRLVIADVDGTLLTPDKTLTVRAAAAVREMGRADIAFTITSGRPPQGLKTLITQLRLRHPIAAFNGGLFVQPDLSVMQQQVIPAAAVQPVIDILIRHGLGVWSYSGSEWRVSSRNSAHVDREARVVGLRPIVGPTLPGTEDPLLKIVGVTDDRPAMARAVEEIQRTCGHLVSAALSQPYYLDITHRDANKGRVVEVLSGLLHIPVAQIATIGDMPSDVPMFRRSRVSVAMANASEDVRRAATFVTASNAAEGFALAVERVIAGGGAS